MHILGLFCGVGQTAYPFAPLCPPLSRPINPHVAEHMHDLHGDFEDNLILAAVETSNADYFITNDTSFLGKSSCAAFTCADMLAFLRMPKA